MASKNEITGDLIMSGKTTESFRSGYERIFKDKKPVRGRFVFDPELKEMVPAHEYYEKRAEIECKSRSKTIEAPAFHFFKSYKSPVSGREIDSPNKERDELDRHNCRIFEDFSSEKKAVNQVKTEKKHNAKKQIRELMQKTKIGLRDKMIKPATFKD